MSCWCLLITLSFQPKVRIIRWNWWQTIASTLILSWYRWNSRALISTLKCVFLKKVRNFRHLYLESKPLILHQAKPEGKTQNQVAPWVGGTCLLTAASETEAVLSLWTLGTVCPWGDTPAALLLVLTLRLGLAEPLPSGHYWSPGQRAKQDTEGNNVP